MPKGAFLRKWVQVARKKNPGIIPHWVAGLTAGFLPPLTQR